MTQNEMQAAAKKFAAQWLGKGDEKQETQRFWIELLGEVLGIRNPASYIEFEKRVKLSHTNYIDAYIPETKVLIEQKGIKIDLKKAYEQSDGTILTPYEQAKRYVNDMKASEKPRWIVVCNFAEFDVYDMENPQNLPEVIFLKDLEKDFYRLEFLVDRKNGNIRREEEISLAAGKLVGKMYDALVKEFIPQSENGELTADQARSLNILCVRLVFCFYAEDAGLFSTRTAFEDYLRSFNLQNVRLALINLFKALDTKIEERDKYDTSLAPFPYVNGGLFKDEKIEIPNFTQKIADVLCNDCAAFNWSEISPTIFGAVFESTLNPETRRKGGMHYTSIENIHKVIDPLFMDSLNNEFKEICGIRKQSRKQPRLFLIFVLNIQMTIFLSFMMTLLCLPTSAKPTRKTTAQFFRRTDFRKTRQNLKFWQGCLRCMRIWRKTGETVLYLMQGGIKNAL
nr:type IIL restriction-modification enzyme MmeI [uncultured Treponema sp.]